RKGRVRGRANKRGVDQMRNAGLNRTIDERPMVRKPFVNRSSAPLDSSWSFRGTCEQTRMEAAMDVGTTYRRSVEFWATTVSRATGDWSDPTPCTDWNVRQLVNHVVGEELWTKPLVDRKTIADVGNSLDGDLLGDNPQAVAQAAADEALAAVAAQLPRGGTVNLSYGDEDIAEYIRQLTADHLIHAWDLAAGTGQERSLDEELVTEVAAWYRDREQLYRSGGAVADRPESAKGGDPQSDLLIAFGRDPNWGS
ncbi:MAG TPA: TIGR03086 family metal-binding protein, partial [Propionibacteriaceae bacterium]|nr:TIGR03086 family metal-binding protein [Propionibacteriaceae bacterium]